MQRWPHGTVSGVGEIKMKCDAIRKKAVRGKERQGRCLCVDGGDVDGGISTFVCVCV